MFDPISLLAAALLGGLNTPEPADTAPPPAVVQTIEPPSCEDNIEDVDPCGTGEDVMTDQENADAVAAMCAEWNTPDHGTWALDPGDTDDEYTQTMNDQCTPNTDPDYVPDDSGEPGTTDLPVPPEDAPTLVAVGMDGAA